MGLFLGGFIIGRIFASEIFGAYFREGLFICLFIYLFIFIFYFFLGRVGLLSEFYGSLYHLAFMPDTGAKKCIGGSLAVAALKLKENNQLNKRNIQNILKRGYFFSGKKEKKHLNKSGGLI